MGVRVTGDRMPKIKVVSPVDVEIRRRMEEGMLSKTARDITGNDEEYSALLRLARLAGVDPLVHTYLEIDTAVQAMWSRYREAGKQLNIKRRTLE